MSNAKKGQTRATGSQQKTGMPSFVCDQCQETLKKPKLDAHTQRCRGASFSCIDCYKSFKGTEYRSHFSCITEVEKYEKKKPVATTANNASNNNNQSQSNNKSNKPMAKPVTPVQDKVKVEVATSTPTLQDRIKEILSTEAPLTLKVMKKQLKSKGVSKKEFKAFFDQSITFKIDSKGAVHVNLTPNPKVE